MNKSDLSSWITANVNNNSEPLTPEEMDKMVVNYMANFRRETQPMYIVGSQERLEELKLILDSRDDTLKTST